MNSCGAADRDVPALAGKVRDGRQVIVVGGSGAGDYQAIEEMGELLMPFAFKMSPGPSRQAASGKVGHSDKTKSKRRKARKAVKRQRQRQRQRSRRSK